MTVVLSTLALIISAAAFILAGIAFVLMLRRVQPVAEPKKNPGSRHRAPTTVLDLEEVRAAQEESRAQPKTNPFDAARELLRRPPQTKRETYQPRSDPDFPYGRD